MIQKQKKKIIITFIVLIIINFAIIFASIKDGQGNNDPMYRFRERQAVTFISALTLGLTSLTALSIYLLKKKHNRFKKKLNSGCFQQSVFSIFVLMNILWPMKASMNGLALGLVKILKK
ncbi:MAG: hypothetical protein K9L84_00050 [Candidatus Omnitrophica bacterium]|nr:hypothetical protein [Candidatus Omnitrophota bacterium]